MNKSLILVLIAIVGAFARAPLLLVQPDRLVQDSYLVVLHANVSAEMKSYHINRLTSSSSDVNVYAEWTIINGYAAMITSKSALESLLNDPLVEFVEQDQTVSLDYTIEKPEKPEDFETGGMSPLPEAALDSVASQTGLAAGLWGLSRSWQRTRTLTTEFRYWLSGGNLVDAYILDTGINTGHTQFTGRVGAGTSFVSDGNFAGVTDGNGHGTHVASTIGGTTYGLAKRVNLIAVKVLSASGSGTNAGVVNGINWVGTNYNSRRRPSVANMSLGGGASAATDNAIASAVSLGVTFVVAAGNDNANACNYSPARATSAWTVGSTTNTDARSSFSNFGTCVDIFAPGSSILGAWIGSTTATNTISGTSMASPHAAGGVALHLGHLIDIGAAQPTPAQVRSSLNAIATLNVVTTPGTGSPNRLLYAATA